MHIKIKKILKAKEEDILNKTCTISGFVKTIRTQKTFAFIEINDGSIFSNIQAVIESNVEDYAKVEKITNGSSLAITGKIVKSPGKNQKYEIKAEKIKIFGTCDSNTYPLQKKRHSFEFLRTLAHLRPRTNTQGAIARVRNALSFATHKFFQERDFLYIQTPIITSSDCEGGGEMFKVTTLGEKNSPLLKDGSLDFSKDFFSRPTFLTVSGQLNAEILACSLCDVYTFGPTFRAENSHTSRHLAEFWMIEPEMAFTDLNKNIEVAEEYLKYLIKYVLETCEEDMAFFDKFVEKNLLQKLNNILKNPFEILPYTKAIEILKKSKENFEFKVQWGVDLQSEHERYLTENFFKKPVVVIDYPSKIKAFYMKQNEDNKTVAAMDVLVPKIGEIIGGSQREDDYDVLKNKIKEMELEEKDYLWYLDLRKYGSVPHSGFGLGFERMVQFITGMENVRDVIPFPRYPGHAEF
jgi:asparaginyl-tRNA synthetase